LKAGLMEIADVFVVNKADRDGADRVVASIEATLSLSEGEPATWRPPVITTVATQGTGVAALIGVLARFRAETREGSIVRQRARDEWRLGERIAQRCLAALQNDVLAPGEWAAAVDRVTRRESDPYTVAEQFLARIRGRDRRPEQIDHIGIATHSLEECRRWWQDGLSMPAAAVEAVPSQQVRVQFLGAGHVRVELIEPQSDASPLAKSLGTRGPGLHHVAIRVEDLDGRLAELTARGVRLIDRSARPGAHGTRVAFIHPSATGGVLVELVEHPKDARAPR
jgi:methylmalonyl-CoA epimerase